MIQKLFLLASLLLVFAGITPSLHSETSPPKDIIIQKDGTLREGEILEITQNGTRKMVNFKFSGGQFPIPMDNIRSMTLGVRPEFTEGAKTYRDGDYNKTIALLRPLVDKFTGFDDSWIGEAIGMLTDSFIRQGKTFEAREYSKKLEESFPDSPLRFKSNVIQARTMLEPDKVDQAIQLLTETESKLPKSAVPESVVMSVFSDLHMTLGDAYLIKGDKQKALENFLLVATVYHQPENQAKLALKKANQLRNNTDETVAVK